MRRSFATRAALLALSLLALDAPAATRQPPCALQPLRIPVTADPIAFTPQQEMDLGDAIEQHVRRSLDVVDDGSSEHLQAIGDRILAQLPPTGLTFQFRLVDQPHWNAFAMPGGRIYVTRKLVAFVRSEDELAGVLGHEIGHLVARHSAADLTEEFKRTLKMTTFGDRRDIFDKYRQFVERAQGTEFNRKRERHQQFEADAVALMAVARAGYAPSAFVELWDRSTETDNKTGNFFSDLFGTTRPESRRLREMLRTMAALPPECRTGWADHGATFAAWQRSVIEGGRAATAADLHTVVRETTLTPPLRGDITHLKFSPDGQHALAQDDASIYVLSKQPFQVRFRVDLDEARPAQFTPDSTTLVAHTPGLRVEWWDVAAGRRVRAFELVGRRPCIQTAVSPDGRILACIDDRYTVLLLDVESGETLFKKERAYSLNFHCEEDRPSRPVDQRGSRPGDGGRGPLQDDASLSDGHLAVRP